MIVHVVARQIGERAGGEPHAVEPLLVETVRGGLDREVRDAIRGKPIEKLVQTRSGPASSAIRKRSAGATRRRSSRSKRPRVPAPARSGARTRRPKFSRWCQSPRRSSPAGADRSARRREPSAARASATLTKAALGVSAQRSATIAAAPFATASPTCLRPSSFAPASAKKTSPGAVFRLSNANPAIARDASARSASLSSRMSPSRLIALELTPCRSCRRRLHTPVGR